MGGLGARVRRGWGSVALTSLDICGEVPDACAPAKDRDAYKHQISELPKNPKIGGAEYCVTSLAGDSSIYVGTKEDSNSLKVLDCVGTGLKRYRGWSSPDEGNFVADHHWFKEGDSRKCDGQFPYDVAGKPKTINTNKLPQRAVFGLPHNYYSPAARNNGVSLAMNVEGPKKKVMDRRASPLFIHVHKTLDQKCFGVLFVLPTKFLPDGKIGVDCKTKDYHFEKTIITNMLIGLTPSGVKSRATPISRPKRFCDDGPPLHSRPGTGVYCRGPTGAGSVGRVVFIVLAVGSGDGGIEGQRWED